MHKPKGIFAKLMSTSTPPPLPAATNAPVETNAEKPAPDTMVSRNHDTTTPEHPAGIFEVVRKAVKQIGKEAATHRFTIDEKNFLAEVEYTFKRKGVRTSENKITCIAINYFIEDYRQHGEQSILSQALKRLNS